MRWLVVAFALCACAHRQKTSPCGDWQSLRSTTGAARGELHRPDATIHRVAIVGAPRDLAAALEARLESKAGDRIHDAPIRRDVRMLWSLNVFSDVRVEATPASGGVDVNFVVAPDPLVERVRFDGARTPELRRLELLVGTPLEARRVERIGARIERTYRRDGYLDARVVVRRRGAELCVAADRGPRVTISAITFRGGSAVDPKVLHATLADHGVNQVGGTFDAAALEDGLTRVIKEYAKQGYMAVGFAEPVLARRGNRLAIEITIHQGPRFLLGTIQIAGTLRRFDTGLRSGDIYSPAKRDEAIDKLMRALPDTEIEARSWIDRATRRVDVTFHIRWKRPWDIVRSLP